MLEWIAFAVCVIAMIVLASWAINKISQPREFLDCICNINLDGDIVAPCSGKPGCVKEEGTQYKGAWYE